MLAGVVALVGMADKSPGTLKLRELDIVDDHGEACIKLREMGGYPTILLKGPKSKGAQAAIGVTEHGTSVILTDANSQMARLAMSLTREGAIVGIRDKGTGKMRVFMESLNSGKSNLAVASGVDRDSGVSLTAAEDGSGFILEYDKDGKMRPLP